MTSLLELRSLANVELSEFTSSLPGDISGEECVARMMESLGPAQVVSAGSAARAKPRDSLLDHGLDIPHGRGRPIKKTILSLCPPESMPPSPYPQSPEQHADAIEPAAPTRAPAAPPIGAPLRAIPAIPPIPMPPQAPKAPQSHAPRTQPSQNFLAPPRPPFMLGPWRHLRSGQRMLLLSS